jgi:hypothetical protein
MKISEKLSNVFGTCIEEQNSILSDYPIGIEIEVKFSNYFPFIYNKYLSSGKIYSLEEQNIINEEISILEKPLLDKLEKTIEAGIPRGKDKYWEFSFLPQKDLTELYYQVEILKKVNLIPKGEHSLHITIGDYKINKKIYCILMAMELLFTNKERIFAGFPKDGNNFKGWARKGNGGILVKDSSKLVNSSYGVELRTLTIDENTNIYDLFYFLNYLINNKNSLNSLRDKMIEVGLPDKNWEVPFCQYDTWTKYIEKFDELKVIANLIFNDFILSKK